MHHDKRLRSKQSQMSWQESEIQAVPSILTRVWGPGSPRHHDKSLKSMHAVPGIMTWVSDLGIMTGLWDPYIMTRVWDPGSPICHDKSLRSRHHDRSLRHRQSPVSWHASETQEGVMTTDWDPGVMIGERPRRHDRRLKLRHHDRRHYAAAPLPSQHWSYSTMTLTVWHHYISIS